jgi:multiple sugar transport system ATP-binding protein
VKAIENGSGLLNGYTQGEVILGIRPEHMEDRAFVETCDPDRILSAAVSLVEPMGSNTHLRMKINDTEMIACVDSRTEAKVDEVVSLVCDLSRVCLFDKESGRLLGEKG